MKRFPIFFIGFFAAVCLLVSPAPGSWLVTISTAVASVWGGITGTLSSQTDLQSALDDKAPKANPTFTGVASFPDGSSSAPSISNADDTNTGFFFSAADEIQVTTGGNAGFKLTNDGSWSHLTGNGSNAADIKITNGNFHKSIYIDGAIIPNTADSTTEWIGGINGTVANPAQTISRPFAGVGTKRIYMSSAGDPTGVLPISAAVGTIKVETGYDLTLDTDQVIVPDGSSSTPSLGNSGDENTGIFFPNADEVSHSVGGTEVGRFGLVSGTYPTMYLRPGSDGISRIIWSGTTDSADGDMVYRQDLSGKPLLFYGDVGNVYFYSNRIFLNDNSSTGYFSTSGSESRLCAGGSSGTSDSACGVAVNDSGEFHNLNNKTPASATAACTAGETAWDSSYIYVCVATDTWKRSALSTW